MATRYLPGDADGACDKGGEVSDLTPEMEEFLMVVRRALLMVAAWIEKKCRKPRDVV